MRAAKSRKFTSIRRTYKVLLVAGSTALAAGEIAGVYRNTAVSYFMRLRR